ncbi:MAG TPA: D-alanyl-D-alanine carboxypeptidase/D-alanyl-D-alanine-endopeptidase [Thermoanaerobaculia bacterium]|nr:D-alanyl-D-alanine carboxypeptidase/D-alanyl-D-alanine-endopeptidase [Thermoanaerobaculia bacterium]
MLRLFSLLRRIGAVFLVFLLASPLSAADFGPLRAALERAATRIPGQPSGVSIEIVDDETGDRVFERTPDVPETIASITKLIATASAVHYLGPDYKFKTSFWRRGEVQQGSLVGSLLVVGGGDPNISGRFYDDDINAVFDKWAEGLRQAGIARVTGDIVLNASFFDSMGRHPEWPAGQESRWYQAPISALSYNDNVVLVSIRPGSRPGRAVGVSIEPPVDILRPVALARTVGRKGRVRVAVSRAAGSDAVTVSGTVPLRPAWWSTPITIDDPPIFFGKALANRLRNAGIFVSGKVLLKAVKPDSTWVPIATTESDLMPTIEVCNRRSQGFYAEQIFKTISAEKSGQGSWAGSVALAKQFLAGLGLDPTRFQLRDGSGLSPGNRAAAADLVRFLRAMERHPQGELWRSTLAVSGEKEGTLRHRLKDALTRGRVLAKTGSLERVSTLAGYARAESGRTYVFAILLNGRGVSDGGGQAFQDRLLRALIANG